MDTSGFDAQSIAMTGGFFVAGFAVVWIFLTLRQGEKRTRDRGEEPEE